MRSFRCDCGNKVYFENDRCLRCGRALAFDLTQRRIRPTNAGERLCANHAAHGTCNWLAAPAQAYCASCSLNEIVPDLADRRRVALYRVVEQAKRRLLFSLYELRLPVQGRAEHEHGLSFRILADARLDGESLDDAFSDAVMTGHVEGCITINLLEADPQLRERMRLAMREDYRTLLGHFRHESGHYYWQRLVAQAPCKFRGLFGDERQPYQESLDAYYRDGAPPDWQQRYVDAYAASHPLEDFAECWAHYLHMVDTLQTAADTLVQVAGLRVHDPVAESASFDELVAEWRELATAMNDLNRSMGLGDPYPFALPPGVVDKLRFIHELIGATA